MSKNRLLFLAKFGVSFGLIALMLLRSDFQAFRTELNEANLLYFGAALFVTAFNMLVRSYKWQLLLKVQGAKISLTKLQSLNYMSLFFNNLFLGSIGGDVFRVHSAIGYSKTKGGAAASVIMERATGLTIALLLVIVLGVAFLFTSQSVATAWQLVGGFAFGAAIMGGVVVAFRLASNVAGLPMLDKIPNIKNLIEESKASIREYTNHREVVIASLGLSLLYHIGNSVTFYFFALAANADVSVLPFLFIAPLVALLVMIPISVNGLGIQEGSYVFYLEQIGVAGPAALLAAVFSRATLLILGLFGGLLFLTYKDRPRQAPTRTERTESLTP